MSFKQPRVQLTGLEKETEKMKGQYQVLCLYCFVILQSADNHS